MKVKRHDKNAVYRGYEGLTTDTIHLFGKSYYHGPSYFGGIVAPEDDYETAVYVCDSYSNHGNPLHLCTGKYMKFRVNLMRQQYWAGRKYRNSNTVFGLTLETPGAKELFMEWLVDKGPEITQFILFHPEFLDGKYSE